MDLDLSTCSKGNKGPGKVNIIYNESGSISPELCSPTRVFSSYTYIPAHNASEYGM